MMHATYIETCFRLQVKSLACGGQDFNPRRSLKHLAEQSGSTQQMLKVIHHEQHLLFPQVAEELVLRAFMRGKREIQHLSNPRDDVFGGADGRQ